MEKSNSDNLRIKHAFWLALIGIGLVVVLICILIFRIDLDWTPSDVTSIVGLLTGLIGTIVGAFMGSQIGAAGKQEAEQRAEKAQRRIESIAAVTRSNDYSEAKKLNPDAWT